MLTGIIPTATIDHVPVRKLNKRFNGFKALYDTENRTHIVKVRGYFTDKQGEIAFLNRDWYTVDLERSSGSWLCILMDVAQKEWCMLRPENDIIDEIKIAVFQ